MSKVLVEESSLHGVGNGIRYVNGENTTYKPSEFEDAIKDLKPNLGTKTLTENGTFPAADDDLDGFSSVKVAVPPSGAVLVEKEITENGDYDPLDDDADGYSAVSVDVPNSYAAEDEGKVVDGGELVSQTSRTISENGTFDTTLNDEVIVDAAGDLEHLSVTENGVYTPGTGVDGFDQVTVNVSGSGDETLPGELSMIAYGNGVFAAIGNDSVWGVSGSGSNWFSTPAFAPQSGSVSWGGIVFTGDVFVAYGTVGGSSGYPIIIFSADGIVWTEASSYGQTALINGIVGGGGKAVCFLKDTNKALYSEDGSVWTEVTLPVTWAGTVWGQTAYDPDAERFVAVGRLGDENYTGIVLVSDDGETWSAYQVSDAIRDATIVAGFGVITALPRRITPSNTAYYSYDGETWTQITLPVSNLWVSAAYGGRQFLAVFGNNEPYALWSADGISWYARTFVASAYWRDVAFGAGAFVAVDSYHEVSARYGGNMTALTVTENGTYLPQSGVDGFSSVVVNVSGGGSNVLPGAVRLTPISSNNATGYISTNKWYAYQANYATCRSDIFELDPTDGETRFFLVFVGQGHSNRFRILLLSQDPTLLPPGVATTLTGAYINVLCTGSGYPNTAGDDKNTCMGGVFTISGISTTKYLIVQKTNQNIDDIESYVIDLGAVP